jgi:hypothetical protein
VALQCSHDTTSDTSLPSLVSDPEMWIHRTASLGTSGLDTHNDVVVQHEFSTTLSATAGAYTNIVEGVLAPGSYVLSANGDVVNFDASDFVRCRLLVDIGGSDSTVATSASVVGNYALDGGVGEAQVVAGVDLIGSVTVASGPNGAVWSGCSVSTIRQTGPIPTSTREATCGFIPPNR